MLGGIGIAVDIMRVKDSRGNRPPVLLSTGWKSLPHLRQIFVFLYHMELFVARHGVKTLARLICIRHVLCSLLSLLRYTNISSYELSFGTKVSSYQWVFVALKKIAFGP